jgi:tripeptidyl-peptidase-1
MRLFSILEALALVALAVIPAVDGRVHEKLSAVPHGWYHNSSPKLEEVNIFTIALHREFEGLERRLLDVSTPGSPNYGKWLDRDTVDALYPVSTGAAGKVIAWLRSHGIKQYQVDGAFIDFAADLGTVNSVLGASYQRFSNNGVTKLRTLQYSIPDDLQDVVAFVDPGTFFGRVVGTPAPVKERSSLTPTPTKTKRGDNDSTATNATVDASCETSITPQCLRQLYNIGGYQADIKSGSRIGFGSFLNESALYSDLAIYEQFFGIASQNFTKVIIANATNDQDPATGSYGEADLDVQNIVGIAHPLPVTEFLTGGSPYVSQCPEG